jgi:hypothetical protein
MPLRDKCRQAYGVLIQLLPGVRHVRGPLVVGILWLLVGWLIWGRHLPKSPPPNDLLADIYRLVAMAGQPATLAAIGLLAYFVGVLIIALPFQAVSTSLFLLRMVLDVSFHPSSESGLVNSFELFNVRVGKIDELAAAIAGLVSRGRAQPLIFHEIRLRKAARKALALDVANAAFTWPSAAPELFQEYDRRQAEAELAQGVPLPMAAASITLLLVDESAAAKAISLVLLLIAVGLMIRGGRLRRELVQFVYEAAWAERAELTHTAKVMDDFANEIADWDRESSSDIVRGARGSTESEKITATVVLIRERLAKGDLPIHQNHGDET